MFIGTYNGCLLQRIRISIPLSIIEKNQEPGRGRKNVTGGWEVLQHTWQLKNTCTHICTGWFHNLMSIVQWLNHQTVVEPFHTDPNVQFWVSQFFLSTMLRPVMTVWQMWYNFLLQVVHWVVSVTFLCNMQICCYDCISQDTRKPLW